MFSGNIVLVKCNDFNLRGEYFNDDIHTVTCSFITRNISSEFSWKSYSN